MIERMPMIKDSKCPKTSVERFRGTAEIPSPCAISAGLDRFQAVPVALMLALGLGGVAMVRGEGPSGAAEETSGEVTVLDPFVAKGQSYVIGNAPNANVSKIEVYNTPGAAGDINLALQLSPGVNFVDEGNALYVKGGAPSETKTYVNDILFPTTGQIFAPATGSSSPTLSTAYTHQASLYAGSIPVRYGNALSGVVALEALRPASTSQFTLDLNLGGASTIIQGPLSKKADYVVGASWFNANEIIQLSPKSSTKITKPSRTTDLFLSTDVELGSGLVLETVLYHSESDGGIVAKTPSYIGNFEQQMQTSFASTRVKGQTSGGWDWKIAGGGGIQNRKETFGTLDLWTREKYLTIVNEWSHDLASNASFGCGLEGLAEQGGTVGTVPAAMSVSPVIPPVSVDQTRKNQQLGLYSSVDWRPLKWLNANLGAREDIFFKHNFGSHFEPRGTLAFKVDKETNFNLYSGILTEQPSPAQIAQSFVALKPTRVVEYSAGLDKKGRRIAYSFGVFSKKYKDLIENNLEHMPVGGNQGDAYGATASVKANLTRENTVGVTYTWGHSNRTDPDTGVMGRSGFDVRHTLSITEQIRFHYYWNFSVAYRMASGKPYTPAIGSNKDPNYDLYNPIYAAPQSEELPTFNRFDVALNRTLWIKTHRVIFYLSIINILNHENIYGYTYTHDYSQRVVLPSLFRRTLFFGTDVTF